MVSQSYSFHHHHWHLAAHALHPMVTARCTPMVFAVKPVLSFQLSPAPEPTTTHAQKKNMHKKRTPLHAECHDRCVLRWTKMHYFSPRYIQCSPWCVMFSLVHSCSPWCVHVLPGTFMLSLGYSCSPWDVHALLGTFMWATNPKRHRTFSHATLLLPKSFSNSKALQWVRLLLYPNRCD